MRPEQVHTAVSKGNTRFQICQLISKGVRITHRNGTRMADSIGTVLDHLALTVAIPLPACHIEYDHLEHNATSDQRRLANQGGATSPRAVHMPRVRQCKPLPKEGRASLPPSWRCRGCSMCANK
jgi:hypothetical protein